MVMMHSHRRWVRCQLAAARILVLVLVLVVAAACKGEPAGEQGETTAGPSFQEAVNAGRRVRCVEQISGGVIREYARWRRDSVRVGSVWLWPARGFADVPPAALVPASESARGPRFFPDQLKIQLLVPRGERVVVLLRDPSYAAFFFGSDYPRRGLSLSDGDVGLAMEGCATNAYTEYSSGLAVAGPGCLEVAVVSTERTTTRSMPVGTSAC